LPPDLSPINSGARGSTAVSRVPQELPPAVRTEVSEPRSRHQLRR